MTETNSINSAKELPAELVGYANPLGLLPSFVIPVFDQGDGSQVVQIVNNEERIEGFAAYTPRALGPLNFIRKQIWAQLGDTALHGFVFDADEVEIAPKEQLVKKLIQEKPRLTRHHFLYIDILEYLGKYEEIDAELTKLQDTYRLNPSISQDMVALERRCLAERRLAGSVNQPPLIFADENGFLNFHDLEREINHLISTCGRAYVRLKLLRSFSGMSPKVKNMLSGLGLRSQKIDSETGLIPVDKAGFQALKLINDMAMISEVQARGTQTISIRAVDPIAIRKRYFKKDRKKTLKSSTGRDYFCTLGSQTSIFISFSKNDEQFVKHLSSRMTEENLSVALLQEKSAKRIRDEFAKALELNDKVVVVLSKAAMKRKEILSAIQRVKASKLLENRRKLFPIRLIDFESIKKAQAKDSDCSPTMKDELGAYQVRDFSRWKDKKSFEREFDKLLRDLQPKE